MPFATLGGKLRFVGISDAPVRGLMLDRQKVESVLARRFPGSAPHQVAAAANAIMGLDDEWEEIDGQNGPHSFAPCHELCYLGHVLEGAEVRLFRRRSG
jgi:hypothetical protein